MVLVDNGSVSLKAARELFPDLYGSDQSPEQLVQEKGVTQISDEATLDALIDDVLAKNQTQVSQYREGKTTLWGYFVGQVMKASGGKANPTKVNERLKQKLST